MRAKPDFRVFLKWMITRSGSAIVALCGLKMLNLDHLQTPHVFAAAKQLDLILQYSKLATLGSGKHRFDFYQIVEPAFGAL